MGFGVEGLGFWVLGFAGAVWELLLEGLGFRYSESSGVGYGKYSDSGGLDLGFRVALG